MAYSGIGVGGSKIKRIVRFDQFDCSRKSLLGARVGNPAVQHGPFWQLVLINQGPKRTEISSKILHLLSDFLAGQPDSASLMNHPGTGP